MESAAIAESAARAETLAIAEPIAHAESIAPVDWRVSYYRLRWKGSSWEWDQKSTSRRRYAWDRQCERRQDQKGSYLRVIGKGLGKTDSDLEPSDLLFLWATGI